MKLSEATYKAESTANPISPNIFCADPTGVEYEGRLYVYGTNDQQQAEQGWHCPVDSEFLGALHRKPGRK